MNEVHKLTPQPELITALSRAKGSLLGLAVGDAVGVAVEFSSPGTFVPVTDMVGGGPFNVFKGAWTDDTSMALCMADSLIEKNKFDALDQLDKYSKWYRNGYRSSMGRCFDIGNQTRLSIEYYEHTKDRQTGLHVKRSPSNGSLMRLAPIPIAFAGDDRSVIHHAMLSSLTTHAHDEAVWVCEYYASLINGAIQGAHKSQLLQSGGYLMNNPEWAGDTPRGLVAEVIDGSFRESSPPQIKGSGHAPKSMEAALWSIYNTDNFKDAVLAATNLGDDSDTTAAIAGQLAGAIYGIEGIPSEWLSTLHQANEIEELAEKLFAMNSLDPETKN